ncbi:MAG: hypothetical protein QXP53_01330 [Candidatus Pacearchaeota archaeon]
MAEGKKYSAVVIIFSLTSILLVNGCSLNNTPTNFGPDTTTFKNILSEFFSFLDSFEETNKASQLYSNSIAEPEIKKPAQMIELTPQRIQNILQRSEWFKQLPKDTEAILSFYDENKVMRPEKFFVSAGGIVRWYNGEKADLELTVGDYNVPLAEKTSDICTLLTRIAKSKDYDITIYNLFGIFKYKYLQGCVTI